MRALSLLTVLLMLIFCSTSCGQSGTTSDGTCTLTFGNPPPQIAGRCSPSGSSNTSPSPSSSNNCVIVNSGTLGPSCISGGSASPSGNASPSPSGSGSGSGSGGCLAINGTYSVSITGSNAPYADDITTVTCNITITQSNGQDVFTGTIDSSGNITATDSAHNNGGSTLSGHITGSDPSTFTLNWSYPGGGGTETLSR